MGETLFNTKINKKDILLNFGVFIFVSVALCLRCINDNLNGKIFMGFIIFIFFIWTLWRFKTFELNKNELIVKRSFFTSKLDTIYKLNRVSQIIFTFETGKFGGNKIIVYSIFVGDFEKYSINIESDEINFFIKAIEEVGIKVVNNIK